MAMDHRSHEPSKKRMRGKDDGGNGSRNTLKKAKKNSIKPAPINKKNEKKKTAARVDALSWKTISMPDQLDDYEGFFGLEEVDDVQVIRDAQTGQVSYLAAELKNDAGDGNVRENDSNDGNAGDGEEEWEGLATSDENEPSEDVKKPTKSKKTTKEKKAREKQKATTPGFEALLNSQNELEQNSNAISVEEWKRLALSPDTLAALARLRFTTPTQIQQTAIPQILTGNDVIAKASTGSGKTLAFAIPILERFLEVRHQNQQPQQDDGPNKHPLALILSPTRELAHQLDKHISALCSTSALFRGPSIATITGGLSVQKQQRQLTRADIVIATPGRLWEVMTASRGLISSLKKIQFLVIDEADRLLSQGSFKEIEEILAALDKTEDDEGDDNNENENSGGAQKSTSQPRQTLVFSATFDRALQRKLSTKSKPADLRATSDSDSLAYLVSRLNFRSDEPKYIDVDPVNQLAARLKEGLVECTGTDKDLYLYTLLLLNPTARTLVFTNSISAVRRLTPFLQNLNLPALALHSGMPQKARLRSVERFTQDKPNTSSSILIATDVAARGLDIPHVSVVIHYHLPRAADTYVHRSGRTARAGQSGSSILICGPEEVAGVHRLVAQVHARSGLAAPSHVRDSSASDAARQGYYIRTIDIDRRVVARLKPRARLAKQIADTTIAKERHNREDDVMRQAAEELGVDYDSETLANDGPGRRGRGAGRKKKEREAQSKTKTEVAQMRGELKALLKQRVNVGVSEKYLTSGGVDVDELLRQQSAINGTAAEFLGPVQGLQLLD